MFRIQSDDSVISGFYSIAFVEYMIPGKTLLIKPTYFLLMTIKRIIRQYISTLKTNMIW